jgi:hypothetical protein
MGEGTDESREEGISDWAVFGVEGMYIGWGGERNGDEAPRRGEG